MEQRTIGLLWAMLTGLCWGVLAIGLKQALEYASPGTVVWIRMIVAWSGLFAWMAFRRPQSLKVLMRPGIIIPLAGILLGLNFYGYMKGVEHTNASNAQIMIQMGPLLLLLSGILYFKEGLRRNQKWGLIVAGTGFGLFFWDQILATLSDAPRYISGNLWLLFASVVWAGFAMIQKGLKNKFSPQEFNLVIFAVCSLFTAPMVEYSEIPNWTLGVWVLMILLGFNSLIAYGGLAEALSRAPASQVSVVISCNPLITIFLVSTLGAMNFTWINYEPIGWRGFLGAGFVVMGVILTIYQKPLRKKGRPRNL